MGITPSWTCDPDAANKLLFSLPSEATWNLALTGPVVSEEKMFEECGRRTDDGRTDGGDCLYYKLNWALRLRWANKAIW